MPTTKVERVAIRASDDVVIVRQQTRVLAVQIGLSLVEQTKLVTAASELARDTLELFAVVQVLFVSRPEDQPVFVSFTPLRFLE